MKKIKINYKKLIIVTLVLFISIGFAYLTTNLQILGVGHLKKTTWDIYFDNINITKGEELAQTPPTTTQHATTNIEYNVNFNTPGDVFSFDVDVVNGGTIDAMISILSNEGLSAEEMAFANYEVTYKDGSQIQQKNFLGKHSKDTITVTITYRKDIDETALLNDEKSVNFNLSLEYQQATDADERENTSNVIVDISGNNNNAIMYGGTINEDGSFIGDGVDDFIDCGFENYEFNDSVTVVYKGTMNLNNKYGLGNIEGSGFGFYIFSNKLGFLVHTNDTFSIYLSSIELEDISKNSHVIVATYDGSNLAMYIDGVYSPLFEGSAPTWVTGGNTSSLTGNITPSPLPFYIGGNPEQKSSGKIVANPVEFTLEEFLLFNDSLTSSDISTNYSSNINVTSNNNLMQHLKLKS